jgi:hypothetical protein
MDNVKYILKIWTKLSTHVRFRDRSVKVLQYGCQMLLGYYGSQFSKVQLSQQTVVSDTTG